MIRPGLERQWNIGLVYFYKRRLPWEHDSEVWSFSSYRDSDMELVILTRMQVICNNHCFRRAVTLVLGIRLLKASETIIERKGKIPGSQCRVAGQRKVCIELREVLQK